LRLAHEILRDAAEEKVPKTRPPMLRTDHDQVATPLLEDAELVAGDGTSPSHGSTATG
jgi:hypothetical protein